MQIKDIVLKFKGVCTKGSTSSYKRGLRSSAANSEVNSEIQYPYMGGVSLGSTPPWDLPVNFTGGRSDQRFIGGTSGNRTPTVQEPVVAEPEAAVEEDKEWVAQVEPGVDVTFLSLPDGGNDLKRIRFKYVYKLLQALIIFTCLVLLNTDTYTNTGHNTDTLTLVMI